MKESEKTNDEPLIDKEAKQENIDVLDKPKENKDKAIDQLEIGKSEEESEESNKLLQDKLISTKYSKDDAQNDQEDEGMACPSSERYTYDPYLESNFINRFFFYWAFTILRMAKKYRLKTTDLGTPAPNNNARIFARHLHRIWDELGYKNYENYALFRTVVRSNACPLITVMILSALQAGLDYFSVIIPSNLLIISIMMKIKKEIQLLLSMHLYGF